MRSFTSVIVALNLLVPPQAFADVTPRRSFWLAAQREQFQTGCGRLLATAEVSIDTLRAHVAHELEPFAPRTWTEKLAASFSGHDADAFHEYDTLSVPLRSTTSTEPTTGVDQALLRRLNARLNMLEEDLHGAGQADATPIVFEAVGPDAIRAYFAGVKESATRFEVDQKDAVESATRAYQEQRARPRPRDGQFWRDLGRTVGSLAVFTAFVYLTKGKIDEGFPGLGLAAGLPGIGFGLWGMTRGGGHLITHTKNFVERQSLDMEHEARLYNEASATPAYREMLEADRLLSLLDRTPPPTSSFSHVTYSLSLPLSGWSDAHPNRLPPRDIVGAERHPHAYDALGRRWIVVDEILDFDAQGEPRLRVILSEKQVFNPVLDQFPVYH